MPLRLDIRRELTARSERVKSVDLHPTEPWLLCSLYSGQVHIWNTTSSTLIKNFEGSVSLSYFASQFYSDSMRPACSSCEIRAKKKLGCFWFGRYARARVQLQHSRKTARIRSALRLYPVIVFVWSSSWQIFQMHRRASFAAIHSDLFWRYAY